MYIRTYGRNNQGRITDPIAKKFRTKAMEQYGYKKGAVKAALQDLITHYISTGETDWRALRGL